MLVRYGRLSCRARRGVVKRSRRYLYFWEEGFPSWKNNVFFPFFPLSFFLSLCLSLWVGLLIFIFLSFFLWSCWARTFDLGGRIRRMNLGIQVLITSCYYFVIFPLPPPFLLV